MASGLGISRNSWDSWENSRDFRDDSGESRENSPEFSYGSRPPSDDSPAPSEKSPEGSDDSAEFSGGGRESREGAGGISGGGGEGMEAAGEGTGIGRARLSAARRGTVRTRNRRAGDRRVLSTQFIPCATTEVPQKKMAAHFGAAAILGEGKRERVRFPSLCGFRVSRIARLRGRWWLSCRGRPIRVSCRPAGRRSRGG